MKLLFNLRCRDIEAQLAFYRALLDLPEAAYTRSPSFRSVHTPDFLFGFEAAARRASPDRPAAARRTAATRAGGYPIFLLDTPAEVDAVAARVEVLGGQLLRAPFATAYGQWQALLADPEHNRLRLACEDLPPGISAPSSA
ncbi:MULTISPECIES: VOC family protein [Hydrogenophaga]|uniref:Glyoxalase/fosfomycin resistance/dioxygenase domain-containing protein n=1 Tax=Hydrogenophaga electricum TaxID=1230953 RepID=A0ABQ6C8H7_9BURK|nr:MULTISPECIES: VOC family protein [Hydrogenophaga]GLS16355.1 hypothetical protein GCM10007935_37950 [Hydrogenophaga electricum]